MGAASDFARFGVATTYMAAGYSGLIDIDLVQIIPGTRVAGPARTVRCGQDDNLMVHAVMASVEAGDVLVITMPAARPVSLLGELLATQAAHRGAAGVLVDAAVRDTGDLRELGLPIWARWVRVTQAAKQAVGAIDVPVTVGGTTIQPGDIIVLDTDGAVAVPAARQAEVLSATASLVEVERKRRLQYEGGALSLDVMGLRQKLEGR
jgi:4-hydroxy-4-methyl-2-oxoglutarate aldolase